MEPLNDRMLKFLKKHHVLNLATTLDGKPWCCSCFYAFDAGNIRLIFTSDKETRHIREGSVNAEVAGSIALETRIIGKIRGIQFTGTLNEVLGADYEEARHIYLKRFPYARPWLGNTALWSINLIHLKMTDNRLGFGKKLYWYKTT